MTRQPCFRRSRSLFLAPLMDCSRQSLITERTNEQTNERANRLRDRADNQVSASTFSSCVRRGRTDRFLFGFKRLESNPRVNLAAAARCGIHATYKCLQREGAGQSCGYLYDCPVNSRFGKGCGKEGEEKGSWEGIPALAVNE